MIDKKIEGFLEKANMNYLFCLLSKLESQRINQFPSYVKQKFDKKITVLAMEHVADNEVPDYISELAEAELALAAERMTDQEDDDTLDFGEETIDDSAKFTQGFENDEISSYESFEEVKDPFAHIEDDADDDDFDDDDDDDEI